MNMTNHESVLVTLVSTWRKSFIKPSWDHEVRLTCIKNKTEIFIAETSFSLRMYGRILYCGQLSNYLGTVKWLGITSEWIRSSIPQRPSHPYLFPNWFNEKTASASCITSVRICMCQKAIFQGNGDEISIIHHDKNTHNLNISAENLKNGIVEISSTGMALFPGTSPVQVD